MKSDSGITHLIFGDFEMLSWRTGPFSEIMGLAEANRGHLFLEDF
jgi:hypothetical protein